jgi:hypothetical protein
MFSPISSCKKDAFVKRPIPLFFGLCLVLGIALLSGCDLFGNDTPPDNTPTIIGNWSSDSDSYKITNTTLIYEDSYGFGFEGDIRHIEKFTGTSGVIIVEYTVPPTAYIPPGNFQGVYYKDLTATTVKLGSAYTAADSNTPVEVAALELAKEKFKFDTIDSYGGELTYAAVQTRQ